MYMTLKQAAEKWGISDRRLRILCVEDKKRSSTFIGEHHQADPLSCIGG